MRSGRIGLLMVMAVVMMAGVSVAALPAGLQEVPAGSQLVVVTQPMTQVGAKINMFAQQAGLIPPPQPGQEAEAMDLSAMLGAELGIAQQLDPERGLTLAIGDLMRAEETVVAYIPVRDATAAVQAMGAQPAAGMPGVFQMPDPDMFGYLMPAGRYLVLGQTPEQLRMLPTQAKGVRVAGVEEELISNSEVGVLVDLRAVMPEARKELLAGIADDPDLAEHVSMRNLLISAVDRLGETQRAVAGLSFREQGIALTVRGQAQEGSTLAGYLSGHPTTGTDLLSKAPAADWVTASVYRFDAKLITGPLNALAAAVKQDPTVQGKIQPAQVDQLAGELSSVYQQAMAGGVAEISYLAQGAQPGAMVAQVNVFETAAQMQSVDQGMGLMQRASEIATQAGYPVSAGLAKSAGAVNGTQYDRFVLDLSQLDLPAEVASALQGQLGGAQGQVEYLVARVDETRLATAMNEQTLTQLVQKVKGGGGLNQDAALAKAAGNLPEQANMYVFVQPGRAVQMAMQAMMAQQQGQGGMNPMMMMMPMFSQIQGAVGAAMTAEDGALQVDLFVPTEVVQSSVGMFMQMQMGMMAPPQGGMQEDGDW